MAVVDVTIGYQPGPVVTALGQYCLSVQSQLGSTQTIQLKFCFDELWNYARDTSTTAFDFLVFAMAVYNADRAVNRAIYSSDGWKREIRLHVPVVNVEEMRKAKANFKLAIDFLTGDDWSFDFVQARQYNYTPLQSGSKALQDYGCVSLFSGGLDSLIGFIDGCSQLATGKKILLVSHVELGKEGGDQNRILTKCEAAGLFNGQYTRAFINAGLKIHRGNSLKTEATFRARSILFFAAGIYCAHAISPNMKLVIPENGTISLNIPLDKGRRSACSTRTTHPVFLKHLQAALTEIGIQNQLYNPYQLKSKKDMVDECCADSVRKRALNLLYAQSCSCAKRSHKRYWTRRNVLHCGFCLPCLYRRVSLSGQAEMKNEGVGIDVFNPNEILLNRTDIKRNRDFRALLYFLRNRCNREVIETELIANGITDQSDIDKYSDFILHSYEQVKEWLRIYGDATIRQMAGL